MNRDHSVVFEIAPKHCISNSFVDYEHYSISSKWFLTTVVEIVVIWIKFVPVHFSPLISEMSISTLAICCLTIFNLPLICGPNIPGSYAMLFFTALDFTSVRSHIHNWLLFSLLLSLFILSGAISLLLSSNLLGTNYLWAHLSVSYLFAFSYSSWGSHKQEYEVVCHFFLQWTTLCHNSPPWPVCLGWPHRAWLIISLT